MRAPGESVEGEIRESIQVQALITQIGAKMGMRVWVPRNDRNRVLAAIRGDEVEFLEGLPSTTMKPRSRRSSRSMSYG